MSRNTNQLSVAELLARNGQQAASGSGGRRRRGGGGVPISELSGELPTVDGGSAHAAPDDEDSDTAAAHYAPEGHAGERFSDDSNYSPMSGPITVYNPLDPQQSEPAEQPRSLPPAPPRSGRRRRPDPEDEQPVGGFAPTDPDSAPGPQPWEAGPPVPGGGRAARRRAAEAVEAAAEEPDATGYGRSPQGRFGPAPAPPLPHQGPNGGPPRLGPPAPATEAWSPQGPAAARPAPPPTPATQTWSGPAPAADWDTPAPATEAWNAPAPGEDPRPKLERRRRGARPLPEAPPWPPAADDGPLPAGGPANAEQATTIWPLADRGAKLPPAGTPGPERPARAGALPNGAPPPAPGMDRSASEFGAENGFGDADSFATDIYGPLPPMPGPMPRGSQPETGDFDPDFDPDSDIYEPADPVPESRADRARAALTTKFGAVSGKLGGVRARSERTRESGDDEAADPRRQWLILGGQSVGAAIAGMLMFKGFEKLWEMQALVALTLAVVVILGLVALVRILRRTDDIYSIVIAVVVGVFVTLGPLAFLLSAG